MHGPAAAAKADPRRPDAGDDPDQGRAESAADEEQEHGQADEDEPAMWPVDEAGRPDRHGDSDDHGEHAGKQQVGDEGQGRLAGQDRECLRVRPRLDDQPGRRHKALQDLADAVLDAREGHHQDAEGRDHDPQGAAGRKWRAADRHWAEK
jgi:hypothetical protein